MYKILSLLSFLLLFNQCATNSVGSSLTPEAQVKNLLNKGTNNAFSIFGNPNDFLTNALIEAVMPKELKDINAKLTQMGLNSVVEKQKDIIGSVAKTSITVMKPILTNAIQNITPADAINILSGGKGAATKYFREKTEAQLIKTLRPTVSSELNRLGANQLLNTSIGGSSVDKLLGSILGKSNSTASSQLESYVTRQLVDGMFNVVLDSEMKNNMILNGINSILNGSSN